MACLDIVLVKVFPYEGIPEIMLDFVIPEEKHEKGSPRLVEEMELKYREDFSDRTLFNQKLHSYNGEYANYDRCDYTFQWSWYRYGKLHREGDNPAMLILDEMEDTDIGVWARNGRPYRENCLPTFQKKIKDQLIFYNLENIDELPIYLGFAKDDLFFHFKGQVDTWKNGKIVS